MNNKQSKLIREQRLTKKSPTTVRTSQIPADRPPTPPTRREHKAALRGNTPAGQGGSKPSFGNPKVESTMSDYEYELIGESIWNSYSDIAYLLMGESSGGAKRLARRARATGRPETFRASLRGQPGGLGEVPSSWRRGHDPEGLRLPVAAHRGRLRQQTGEESRTSMRRRERRHRRAEEAKAQK